MWVVFDNVIDAQSYVDAATALLPCGPNDVTSVWDTPLLLTDGRFAVFALDGDGDEISNDLFVLS